ncbi:hypothetical protein HDV00_006132 [Rhizophlyctis rosea]|nr:hypothetical protein HDV00_006132 [Rhizophlyctis rosea]
MSLAERPQKSSAAQRISISSLSNPEPISPCLPSKIVYASSTSKPTRVASDIMMTRSPSPGPVAKAAGIPDITDRPALHTQSSSSLVSILNPDERTYSRSDSYRSATDDYIQRQRSFSKSANTDADSARLNTSFTSESDAGPASALETLASVATELLSMSRTTDDTDAMEDDRAEDTYIKEEERTGRGRDESRSAHNGSKRKGASADFDSQAVSKKQRKRSESGAPEQPLKTKITLKITSQSSAFKNADGKDGTPSSKPTSTSSKPTSSVTASKAGKSSKSKSGSKKKSKSSKRHSRSGSISNSPPALQQPQSDSTQSTPSTQSFQIPFPESSMPRLPPIQVVAPGQFTPRTAEHGGPSVPQFPRQVPNVSCTDPNALRQRLEEFEYDVADRYKERYKIMRTCKTFRTQAAHALISYMIAGRLGRGEEQPRLKAESKEEERKVVTESALPRDGPSRPHQFRSSEDRPNVAVVGVKLESPYPTPNDSQPGNGSSYPWPRPVAVEQQVKEEDRHVPYGAFHGRVPSERQYPQPPPPTLPSIHQATQSVMPPERPNFPSPRYPPYERRPSMDVLPISRPPASSAQPYHQPVPIPVPHQQFAAQPPNPHPHAGPSTPAENARQLMHWQHGMGEKVVDRASVPADALPQRPPHTVIHYRPESKGVGDDGRYPPYGHPAAAGTPKVAMGAPAPAFVADPARGASSPVPSGHAHPYGGPPPPYPGAPPPYAKGVPQEPDSLHHHRHQHEHQHQHQHHHAHYHVIEKGAGAGHPATALRPGEGAAERGQSGPGPQAIPHPQARAQMQHAHAQPGTYPPQHPSQAPGPYPYPQPPPVSSAVGHPHQYAYPHGPQQHGPSSAGQPVYAHPESHRGIAGMPQGPSAMVALEQRQPPANHPHLASDMPPPQHEHYQHIHPLHGSPQYQNGPPREPPPMQHPAHMPPNMPPTAPPPGPPPSHPSHAQPRPPYYAAHPQPPQSHPHAMHGHPYEHHPPPHPGMYPSSGAPSPHMYRTAAPTPIPQMSQPPPPHALQPQQQPPPSAGGPPPQQPGMSGPPPPGAMQYPHPPPPHQQHLPHGHPHAPPQPATHPHPHMPPGAHPYAFAPPGAVPHGPPPGVAVGVGPGLYGPRGYA